MQVTNIASKSHILLVKKLYTLKISKNDQKYNFDNDNDYKIVSKKYLNISYNLEYISTVEIIALTKDFALSQI